MITAAVDPGVGFNFDFFPFMSTLREAVGGGLATALVISVGLVVVAAVMWGVGKITGARSMQSVGFGAFCVTGVVAILIGAANGIAAWGANLDTGF